MKEASKEEEDNKKVVIMPYKLGKPIVKDGPKLKTFLYTKFVHGNMDERYKRGKFNFFRKHILAKRITNTGRGVIVPAPRIKANEVILPRKIAETLKLPKFVLLIRYPSLDFQNITFHKVVGIREGHTIGIPISITKRNGADFDGDEIEVIALDDLKVIAECQSLLDPEYNIASLQKLTLYFGQDTVAACKGLVCENVMIIQNILYNYYCVEGSKKTFDLFHKFESEICEQMWSTIGAGISIKYLIEMNEEFSDDVITFDEQLRSKCYPFTWFVVDCTSFHSLHIYQLVKKLGIRKLVHCKTPFSDQEIINGNFMKGLNIHEFVTHCQASRDSLIDSNFGISIEGYNLFKLGFCSKDLTVHYDDAIYTCGKDAKMVVRKYDHLLNNPSNSYHLPNFLSNLICDKVDQLLL
jgi:hypothetical protein